MSKKKPYGMDANFNPNDVNESLRERGAVPDMGEAQDVFTSAAAGQGKAPELSDAELFALAKERLCASCPQGKEASDVRLRALAEVDNIRKRMLREKDEAIRFAASNVLSDLLPSLDNLDLALEHARGQAACKDLLVGVEMTRKLLLDALKKHGLEPVGEVGEMFDPAFHEAMGTSPDPNVDDGAVCAILNRGYKLNGRLLRPARVIVCKKQS